MAGGSGDADLYVKFGSAPTTSSYDCRPYQSGNAETCAFAPSQEGTYYIMIRGYSAFSGVSLSVEKESSVDVSGWSDLSDLSGSAGTELAWDYYNTGTSPVTFAMAGGSGDADLYVKFGSAPTTSSYDCRPYQSGNAETCAFAPSQEGTYYIMVRGYSAFSGVSLSAEKESSVSNVTTMPLTAAPMSLITAVFVVLVLLNCILSAHNYKSYVAKRQVTLSMMHGKF